MDYIFQWHTGNLLILFPKSLDRSPVVERTRDWQQSRHTLRAQVPRVLCTEPSLQLQLSALVDSPPERPQDKDQTTILAHPGRAYLIDGTVRMYRHLLRTVAPAPVHGPSCSQKFQCRRASGCNGQKLRCTSGRPARLRHEMDGRMGWDRWRISLRITWSFRPVHVASLSLACVRPVKPQSTPPPLFSLARFSASSSNSP